MRRESCPSRTDSAILENRRMPQSLITHSEESYIQTVLRLIHDNGWRHEVAELTRHRSIAFHLEQIPDFAHNTKYLTEVFYKLS